MNREEFEETSDEMSGISSNAVGGWLGDLSEKDSRPLARFRPPCN